MLIDRRRGIAILADRFPQTAVPGPMDGLGLAAAKGRLPQMLARRELAQYRWMEQFAPDLVIRLNVDLPSHQVTIVSDQPAERFSAALAEAGYTPA